jgi:hypothetical protein
MAKHNEAVIIMILVQLFAGFEADRIDRKVVAEVVGVVLPVCGTAPR